MLTDAEFEKLIKQGKVDKEEFTLILKKTKPRIYNGFKGEFTEAKYEVRAVMKFKKSFKDRLNQAHKDFINSSK